jgi:multisubunit Na+/H+ antiporter MnhG subunit
VPREVAVDALLGLAVVLALASSLGVLVMRDAAQKLHYVAPLSAVVPVLTGLAVLVHAGWTAVSAQTWLAVLFLVLASPIVSHATVRSARIRTDGDWRGGGPSGEHSDNERR